MWPLWLVEMSLQHIQKNPTGQLHNLQNLKGIHRRVAVLGGKENMELKEPAEPDPTIYKQMYIFCIHSVVLIDYM